MVIILIGPPGSGKSTQSKLIEQSNNADWVSIGQLLRALNRPELKTQMDKGELLDDDLVNSVLDKHLRGIDSSRLVVIDGFPRRSSQADWLVDFVNTTGHDLKAIIHIVLDEQEARERLKLRGRSDDNDKSVDVRFEEYKRDVLPLVGFFNQKGIPVYEVDGQPSPEIIHDEISRIIDNVYKS